MSKTYTSFFESPLGPLRLVCNEKAVMEVQFCEKMEVSDDSLPPISLKLEEQLKAFFDGTLLIFDLNLCPQGTDFQKRVWRELVNIPFGKTASYLEMAVKLGDPKVIRAAASANGKNSIAIIIPCHRVIGKDGSLTGYAGGLHRKKWLLDHENRLGMGFWSCFNTSQ